jgi:methylisocitrate lyase
MVNTTENPGQRFRNALASETPLQIAGAIHAYAAMLAQRAGFQAIYLSGAGVANASYGLPDLGFTSLDDVLIDVRRITRATPLPLLVDIDTGWDDPGKTVAEMIRAGAAAVHMEDQVEMKRCGHRPGKQLVSCDAMCARLAAALSGRNDPSFVIMARTDAAASEGLDAAIARARAYVAAGADMIFAEAMESQDDYKAMTEALDVPVLANMTEFGKSPLCTTDELAAVGVGLVLYPLSAFRAMNAAAENVYTAIRTRGTQADVIDQMQTRETLYDVLDYHRFEQDADTRLTAHNNQNTGERDHE